MPHIFGHIVPIICIWESIVWIVGWVQSVRLQVRLRNLCGSNACDGNLIKPFGQKK